MNITFSPRFRRPITPSLNYKGRIGDRIRRRYFLLHASNCGQDLEKGLALNHDPLSTDGIDREFDAKASNVMNKSIASSKLVNKDCVPSPDDPEIVLTAKKTAAVFTKAVTSSISGKEPQAINQLVGLDTFVPMDRVSVAIQTSNMNFVLNYETKDDDDSAGAGFFSTNVDGTMNDLTRLAYHFGFGYAMDLLQKEASPKSNSKWWLPQDDGWNPDDMFVQEKKEDMGLETIVDNKEVSLLSWEDEEGFLFEDIDWSVNSNIPMDMPRIIYVPKEDNDMPVGTDIPSVVYVPKQPVNNEENATPPVTATEKDFASDSDADYTSTESTPPGFDKISNDQVPSGPLPFTDDDFVIQALEALAKNKETKTTVTTYSFISTDYSVPSIWGTEARQ